MTGFAAGYTGARFYKCDLQIQTPEDGAHWAPDDSLRLPNPRDEADTQEKAREFLRRCHEVGLDVLGVTDHNFSDRSAEREWFLTHLIQQNRTVAKEVNRPPLHIFPGFEIDIGYHLLCLFNPGTPLKAVSTCLTTLGLAEGKRFRASKPATVRFESRVVVLDTVLRVVQEEHSGIVIAAHAFSNSGIASDSRDSEDYRNERLLAVEVPIVPLTGRTRDILEGNNPSWKRRRPPAYIMSSDCKKLRPSKSDDSNYLGHRHTWIKMTDPNVVALRQAFLDQAAFGTQSAPCRVRFGADPPEKSYTYPKIRSISVRGARFLADQEHAFSPNLNTLIGGRGTGKSTIVEYLRLVLEQEGTLRGDDLKRNLERLKKTVLPDTVVQVEIEKEGKVWTLERKGDAKATVVAGPPIPDLARFFPTRVLSQREISSLAEDREARGRIVDNIIQQGLTELRRRAEDVVGEINGLNTRIVSEAELKERLTVLETEKLDFETRIGRLKALEEPLRRWKGFLAEETYLNTIEREALDVANAIREAAQGARLTAVEEGSDTPNATTIREIGTEGAALLQSLKERVIGAISDFERSSTELLRAPRVARWREALELERAEYERKRAELLTQGEDPAKYLEYQRQLEERLVQIAEVGKTLQSLAELRSKRDGLQDSLRELWLEETTTRRAAARKLVLAIPETDEGKPFVQIEVEAFGEDRAFAQKMQAVVSDRRRLSADAWGAFDETQRRIVPEDSFLARVFASRAPDQSPVDVFADWVERLRRGEKPDGCPWELKDRRVKVLQDTCTEAKLTELRLWRVPDRVKITLFRQDGTRVGELEEGLSLGQRCTAILALLIVQDEAPAVIDQPEEDLDNEFVYRELVPLFRRMKEKRQLIVATHNANLPVNADAELIVAMEVRDERGTVKSVRAERASGGLDRDIVCEAVKLIMEGSEEAFRRRFEKYGF